MKKIIVSLCALGVLALSAAGVQAKPGDIAGNYYHTDIRTYLNGAEIEAINIGGQTLISAEAMQYYSFGVWWDADERTLRIDETERAENGAPPKVAHSNLPSGTPAGYYYETDIVTYLDTTPIIAYNIGGRTFIHAEEMRNYGYDVIWSESERKLEITSPYRAGYKYTIYLAYGKKQTEEGSGSFSARYDNGALCGKGDADYMVLSMIADGRGYTFSMGFYQNEGLFFSTELMNKLRPLCYSGYGVETELSPESLYDEVNRVVSIYVNGHKASKVNIISGAGNGHRDFYISALDLPRFRKDEINDITVTVGEPSGEEFSIQIPEYAENSSPAVFEKMKKYPGDFMRSSYETDEYLVVNMRESESLGIFKDRLYIYNKATGEISEDILEQVRKEEGFNTDVIAVFAFKVGDIKNNLFFSCNTPDRTQDFYVELNSAKVHLR